jgi:5-methylcytosine-specific restriction enzyme A
MPRAPLKPCLSPGCRALVQRGRCERHAAQQQVRELARQREVNARRPEGATSVYASTRWRRARGKFLQRAHRCACGALARYVDHVRPWRSGATEAEREALFWDETNWRPMCGSCHSRKTASRDGGFGNPQGGSKS